MTATRKSKTTPTTEPETAPVLPEEAPAPVEAPAPAKAPRASRTAAERTNEYTHPIGRAAVEFGGCAKCGARKGKRCLSKLGVETNFVHGPRFKAYEASLSGAPKAPRKARTLKAVK